MQQGQDVKKVIIPICSTKCPPNQSCVAVWTRCLKQSMFTSLRRIAFFGRSIDVPGEGSQGLRAALLRPAFGSCHCKMAEDEAQT